MWNLRCSTDGDRTDRKAFAGYGCVSKSLSHFLAFPLDSTEVKEIRDRIENYQPMKKRLRVMAHDLSCLSLNAIILGIKEINFYFVTFEKLTQDEKCQV
jgi:hypothetical protein